MSVSGGVAGCFRVVAGFFRRQRAGQALSLLGAALFPVFCVLIIEKLHYTGLRSITSYMLNSWRQFLFAICVWCVLYAVLLLVSRRAWLAAAILGFFSYVLGAANLIKFMLRGDYVYPWDFSMLTETGELLSFVSVRPTLFMVAAPLFLILYTAALAVTGLRLPRRARLYVTLPLAALLCCGLFGFFSSKYVRARVFPRFGLLVADTNFQGANYAVNGFIGGFALNVGFLFVDAPEGYSPDAAAEILQTYTDTPPAEGFAYPDIIVVLSESFWDVTQLDGIDFPADPLANYHAMRDSGRVISGRFVASSFGGGTVRPEFEMLSGVAVVNLPEGAVPYQQYISAPLWTYLRPYKALGYQTVGLHTYRGNFYNRSNAYPLLGFDTYLSDKDMETNGVPYAYAGPYLSDETMVNNIEKYLEQADAPVFMFAITMENHQPYMNKYIQDESLITIRPESSLLAPDELDAVTGLAQGLRGADESLLRLVEYVEKRERPTLLIFFGDHLPTLGSDYSVYKKCGYISDVAPDQRSRDEQLRMYTTPLVIKANFPLSDTQILDNSVLGEGIAAYHVLHVAASLTGAPKTAYMNWLSDYYQEFPAYTGRIGTLPGGGTTEALERFAREHALLSYDRLFGEPFTE